MRIPFNFDDSGLKEGARIKFIYTSPEMNQNIEISMDGDETSIEALLDAFERFMGALGICIPENAMLGFVNVDEEDEDGKNDGGTIKFTLDDDEEDDEDDDDEEKE